MTVIRGHDVGEAARRLKAGQLVAFPTETVYGLGANALDEMAIQAVFEVKGRPSNHPVIVHVADARAVAAWARAVSTAAKKLMHAFWPGPLTLVLPKHPQVSPSITAGQDTVAIRCPAHPKAQQLLQAFAHITNKNAGVIAPSANRFGQVSPTTSDHVYAEFSKQKTHEIYLLEGASAQVGIESTILDLSQPKAMPRILRPGHIQPKEIAKVLGLKEDEVRFAFSEQRVAQAQDKTQFIPRVSGSLKAHYAPSTPLKLFRRAQLNKMLDQAKGQRIAVVGCGPLNIENQVQRCEWLPAEPKTYATRLYETLRRLDEIGFDALWFEQPAQTNAWTAVNDRLLRAAAAF